MQISSKIKQDIQNSEALKDKIEALNTKIREEVKQNLQQDRTINTMKVTTKSLEQRLAQAQSTIEELNSVKSENE
jgi:predicted RNase H-like nuclease (RuvC/YqgF family)